ncbi:period circadian protein-like [Xyrauchen texanus]|uniref:period circadian protein-like n=1 Tax=Xyrauchen texanus TaxID=154827 RepID=UPI0022423975|nr:period circadian protein-like [Xyrauchen texanus]
MAGSAGSGKGTAFVAGNAGNDWGTTSMTVSAGSARGMPSVAMSAGSDLRAGALLLLHFQTAGNTAVGTASMAEDAGSGTIEASGAGSGMVEASGTGTGTNKASGAGSGTKNASSASLGQLRLQELSPSLLAAWHARVSKVASAEQTVGTDGQPPSSPIP